MICKECGESMSPVQAIVSRSDGRLGKTRLLCSKECSKAKELRLRKESRILKRIADHAGQWAADEVKEILERAHVISREARQDANR